MKKLTLAVPKGSLEAPTLEIFKKAGIFINFSGRSFMAVVEGNSLFDHAILMRPQKIPGTVATGIVDVGITGFDQVVEKEMEKNLEVITELAYGRNSKKASKIVVFGKADKIVDEESTRVSAEYYNLARRIFKKAKIDFSDGGTETDILTGTYHYGVGVCDSGRSLRDNGLKILQVIMESPVVLVAKKNTFEFSLLGEILRGVVEAEERSLIKFDCAEDDKKSILAFLPAIEAPTISRLSNGNYAIETVADKKQIFDLLMDLKRAGARGILTQDINMVLAG